MTMAQSEVMETFINNLKLAMLTAGLKQKDLCARTGIRQPNMSALMSRAANCTIALASEIADAVGYPLHELLNPAFQPRTARKATRKTTSA
jgi:transcriptional regulator with XRE-family HTH domain